MIKKMLTITLLLLLTFTVVIPVYAQTPSPAEQQGQGLLTRLESFFKSFIHANDAVQTTPQGQNVQPSGVPQGNPPLMGTTNATPSGQPNRQQMQENRLNMLVQQGKLTQAQETAIIAEQTKIQNELKAWADAQGINESYVLGGMGEGMGQRFGQNHGTNGQQFMRPRMQQNGMGQGQMQQGNASQGTGNGANQQPPQSQNQQ